MQDKQRTEGHPQYHVVVGGSSRSDRLEGPDTDRAPVSVLLAQRPQVGVQGMNGERYPAKLKCDIQLHATRDAPHRPGAREVRKVGPRNS